MPNRIVKESIRTSDTLASVSAEAERLFWRLVTSADDYGCYDARPNVILGTCMTAFLGRYSENDVLDWLAELETAQLIAMYSVEGRPYLQMTTWAEHQRPPRAAKPKFPLPTENDNGCQQVLSIDSQRQHLLSTAPVSVSVSENKDMVKPPPAADEYSTDFETWWELYPRKVSKRAAFNAWRRVLKKGRNNPIPPDTESLMRAAKNYAVECRLRKTEPGYIMHGSTFLSPQTRRFEDYASGLPNARSPNEQAGVPPMYASWEQDPAQNPHRRVHT